MDLSEKKTVLEDSASIYQRREEKSDRDKWKDLKGFKAKWEHFKAYYLLKTFIWVCVIAFVGYMLYEMFAPEPERLIYVAVLDTVLMNDVVEDLQTGFEEYIGMDEETQDTMFDNSMNISNTRDAASAQMFTVHAYAGEIDVLITTESVVKQYAGTYVSNIANYISEELYDEVADRLYYVGANEYEGESEYSNPFGIYISDLVEPSPYCNEKLVLAISGNGKRGENVEAFIRYLLQRNGEAQSITAE